MLFRSNTRPSPGGNSVQEANPPPLSNEAGAVAKNDESFGGESKFSIDFFSLTKSLPFHSAGVESVGCA